MQQQQRESDKIIYGVYIKSTLITKISLHITEIGKNTKKNLEDTLKRRISNKCIIEGYIVPNSIKIITYSSGAVNSDNIYFHIVYDCMVANPVEGMLIECIVKTITKAGIHAQVIDQDGNIPITVFVARDHHNIDNYFQSIKESAPITVRVIGSRYELYDPFICVIAELVNTSQLPSKKPRKIGGNPKICIEDNDDDI
jgi:DNA-directed RNA polymerase subunit E'/Rpb7